mmetsp:Transcript_1520/g.3198  ORF Transcript_1520/g.3198 Transcript_1520/m.3198 type:complete len:100 (+) Transcript_1520:485-784(+)
MDLFSRTPVSHLGCNLLLCVISVWNQWWILIFVRGAKTMLFSVPYVAVQFVDFVLGVPFVVTEATLITSCNGFKRTVYAQQDVVACVSSQVELYYHIIV